MEFIIQHNIFIFFQFKGKRFHNVNIFKYKVIHYAKLVSYSVEGDRKSMLIARLLNTLIKDKTMKLKIKNEIRIEKMK